MSTATLESPTRATPLPPRDRDTAPPAPGKLTERLLSLDAYRGFIMALLICNGLGLGVFKDDATWGWLARQVDHVKWEGCVFWDLIQPSFMFMVGVAMPFAFAKRRAAGASWREQFTHTLARALGLIFLGIALDCITGGQISLGLMRVLQQIALGYVLTFLLLDRTWQTQLAAALLLLTGYTLAWMYYPGNDPQGAWVMSHQNLGGDFDQWLFSRQSTGYYVVLNFIPATATILFGVVCGRLVGSDWPRRKVLGTLLLAGLAGLALGLALSPAVPLIKRIWTASFTLYAGGWTVLFLGLFYWLIEVQAWRRWPTFLVVVGMNSIFAYTMAQVFRASFFDRAIMVFSKPLALALLDPHHFPQAFSKPASALAWPPPFEQWGFVLQATLVLAAEWGVLYWLYRRKIFFKL